jgi:uncharacterized protein (TIGR03084 family)
MSAPVPAESDNSKRRLVAGLVADLADETRELAATLSELSPADWDRPTPAAGWTVRDQVTHLAFFDDMVLLSLRDQAAFRARLAEQLATGASFPDDIARQHRDLSGEECLSWLTRSREAVLAEYLAADPSARLPWYGPDMGVPSSVTARLMETWAHGQDIRDTIGAPTPVTSRLRHIANLGVRTFAFAFLQRGLPVPEEQVAVRLSGPSGETWTWGPDGTGNQASTNQASTNQVSGGVLDFCLVVTQRRNIADTGLRVEGDTAARWIAIAQVFAGQPTDPRPAGQFAQRPGA